MVRGRAILPRYRVKEQSWVVFISKAFVVMALGDGFFFNCACFDPYDLYV